MSFSYFVSIVCLFVLGINSFCLLREGEGSSKIRVNFLVLFLVKSNVNFGINTTVGSSDFISFFMKY